MLSDFLDTPSQGEGSTDRPGFGYYETIAGGSGAGPGWHGESGVHVHVCFFPSTAVQPFASHRRPSTDLLLRMTHIPQMTNTRITDPEILERR